MKKRYDAKKYLFYDIHWLLGGWLFYLFFRTKYFYLEENTKKLIKPFFSTGAAIIVSNHESYADPVYVQVTFGWRRKHIISASDVLENKALLWLSKRMLAVPVDRNKLTLAQYKNILTVLKQNRLLYFYAEGHINENEGTLEEFKEGPALFAGLANVPIIPMYFVKRRHAFERLKVGVGSPIYLSDLGLAGKDKVLEATKYIHDKTEEVMNMVLNQTRRKKK